MEYDFRKIEAAWQQYWKDNNTYRVENSSSKPKYYVLDMFPYPSGAGLHVGHPLGYIASDIVARYKRLTGHHVLHPMGYDAFGLPAEQYAIQTGRHPADTTKENIARYREQLDKIGFSFDWSREVQTCDPKYYKWTQWIFIQLFKSWYNHKTQKAEPIETLIAVFENEGFKGESHQFLTGDIEQEVQPFTAEEWKHFPEKEKSRILMNFRLAYLGEAWVNWCPALGTVLANDEVKDGVSERGGYPVERKRMPQWSMRITAYAERLLNDLNAIEWSESIKEAQRNWIGRSEGTSLRFKVDTLSSSNSGIGNDGNKSTVSSSTSGIGNDGNKSTVSSSTSGIENDGNDLFIEVFTTRPDTIFGVTFVTLAPEHELVNRITTAEYSEAVAQYVSVAKNKSERERQAEKKVSGQFTGAYVIHPFTGNKVPVYIGEYVLAGYGTGAVMAVPAHDSRDHAFAKHFGLAIPQVVTAPAGHDFEKESYDAKEGQCMNSGFLDGLDVKDAIRRAIEEIEKRGIGKGKVNFRLRDAAFGRQRYWGEPIPVYYKDGVPHTIEEKYLPLELPAIYKFLPTETGEPPLARAEKWHWDPVNHRLTDSSSGYPIETTTMPGWAGSSWYFLRYMDPHNDEELVSKAAADYWKNVDLYLGGAEHATGHLLYVRFWTKFLHDIGKISIQEPAQRLVNQGMIQGMSMKANVIVERNQKEEKYIVLHPDDKREGAFQKNYLVDFVSFSDGKYWIDEAGAAKTREKDAVFRNYYLSAEKVELVPEIEKMSKSKYNVVTPDSICAEYGADTLRLYEMFLGPLEQHKPWSTNGISGTHNFLRRFWRLFLNGQEFSVDNAPASEAELKVLHRTLKKIQEDINKMSFNTCVSSFMIAVNELTDLKCNKRAVLEPMVIALSPFAPHICEELWHRLGHSESVIHATFPAVDEKYLVDNTVNYPVQFNGKMRFTMALAADMSPADVEKEVLSSAEAQKYLEGKTPKKVIVVPKKIVNVVV
ncbi:MAG: leucine--tRNA ligase [Bacteroidia bacterium]